MKINPTPMSLEYGQLPTSRRPQELRIIGPRLWWSQLVRMVSLVGFFFVMLAMAFASVGLILGRGLSGKK